MSVIINDFEIVVETGPEAEAVAAGIEEAPGLTLTPQDIRDILRRQARRTERVRAD